MKRPLHVAEHNHNSDIRIADATGKIVCTLPRDERRLSRFIVRFASVFGFWLRSYNRDDWWAEQNTNYKGKISR